MMDAMTLETTRRTAAPFTTVEAHWEAARAQARIGAVNRVAVAIPGHCAVRSDGDHSGEHRGVAHIGARVASEARP